MGINEETNETSKEKKIKIQYEHYSLYN